MKNLYRVLIALGLLSACMASPDPANPKASPQARAVLNYLQSLESRKDKRTLSGQYAGYGHGVSTNLIDHIREITGHAPAILGVDYADFGLGGLNVDVPNDAAIRYWKQGGLVHISAHLYNPARTNGYGLRDEGVDISSLLNTNSAAHVRWMKELDQLAGGLQQLKAAGVVVLWRPFHEMNGGWFWWGAQNPDSFIKVWRHMFDYFTTTKGLDNLLWIYSPNHGSRTADYYPGDRYVDIIGLDAYTDFVDPDHIKGYEELARIKKPFGFAEFGPHGSENPPGDYDYRRFIDGVQKYFPRTVFFMSWNAKWSLAQNNHTTELLSHPWIVNREDLPRDWTSP